MSKKSIKKTLEESMFSTSEAGDTQVPPHSSLQPNMMKDMVTIIEFMENKEVIREEKRCMVEQCHREEEQQKEKLRERRYQEDADKREK